jgi:hypothetical protein
VRRFIARFALLLATTVLGFAPASAPAGNGPDNPAASALHPQDGDLQQSEAFTTTVAYMLQFYPLWFTYYQSQLIPPNRMVGPDRVSPIYHAVVAINVDTLYASAFLDLSQGPVTLTIPQTSATYSILNLDPYGNIFDPGISAGTPGTYQLIGPGGSTGNLTGGAIPIVMPYNYSILIFRVDRYNVNNEDQTEQANAFRQSLVLAGESTAIKPEIYFSPPFKTAADYLSTQEPVEFLRQLRRAVHSDHTPPLSMDQQALSDKFDSLFGDGIFATDSADKAAFAAGARKAHALLVDNYLTHTGSTHWINFTNIGSWGDNALDRSSITEYIQFGNGHNTAAYFHAFDDRWGRPLDGSKGRGYVLTFPADQIPEAKRFWSVTAYTPDAIQLVPNLAFKYAVASYTPGLQADPNDGSLSIYLSHTPPRGVPEANWLPVPEGPFNVMLRVYGPEGSVADGTYVPPGIDRRRLR